MKLFAVLAIASLATGADADRALDRELKHWHDLQRAVAASNARLDKLYRCSEHHGALLMGQIGDPVCQLPIPAPPPGTNP